MITITNFRGMQPAVTPKRLPEGMAQMALNCDFTRGDLRPMRDYRTVYSGGTGVAPRTIHHYRPLDRTVNYWLRWERFVRVATGNIPGRNLLDGIGQFIFWSNDEQSHTGPQQLFLRCCPDNATDLGPANQPTGNGPPSKSWPVGVPSPVGFLKAQLVDRFGANELFGVEPGEGYGYRMWAYTLVNEWGQEGPMSAPSQPLLCNNPLRDEPWGDFAPSDGAYVKLSVFSVTQGDFKAIKKVRIYRSAAGSSASYWLFAKEVDWPLPSGASIGFSEWNDAVFDNVPDERLGARCTTVLHRKPVGGLWGLTSMPWGGLAAFKDQDIYFSAVNEPYAFPDDFVHTVDSQIRAIAPMPGSGLFVGTTSRPYIVRGSSPASMSISRLDVFEPCIDIPNERVATVAVPGHGVLYPSPRGLILVSASGAVTNVTDGVLTRRQWAWMSSGLMAAASIGGKYVCACRSDDRHSGDSALDAAMQRVGTWEHYYPGMQYVFIFDPEDRSLQFVPGSSLGIPCVSALDGGMYFSKFLAPSWSIVEFNAKSAGFLRYHWKSKPFLVPRTNYGTIKIVAEEYSSAADQRNRNFSTSKLILTVWVDGEERFRSPISGYGPWRMPAGFTGREWEVAIEGTAAVQAVIIGGEE